MAIPEGWRILPILEVVDLPSGQVDPTSPPYRDWPLLAPNHIISGSGRWTQIETAEAQGAISGKYVFQRGDVVYSKIRPYLRKATVVNQAGLCSADMYPLRSRPDLVSEFLLATLLGDDFTKFATSVSARTGIPKINREELAEYRITLPPLPEQKKIAAILSSVDETIAKTESLIAQLQIVKKAMMEQLLTKGMPGRHTRFKQTEVGEIPEEWEVCRLPMIAEYQNGKAFPSNEYRSEGVLLVRPGNMHANGWLSWDDKHTTFLSQTFWDELPSFRVYPGELLMNLTAQSLDDEFLGRVCEVPPGRPCLLNQRIARITPTRSSARYLFWGLRGPHFRKHVDRIPQGSKVQHLYNRDLDEALLALPDTEEQRAIASLLDSIQERLVNETATLLPLRAVKSALSSSLLSGEIRVAAEVA